MREPEVADLRAFCAAASLGSIAGAARSLNVSQPALSKRLRMLETLAGEALFERSTRGVRLTAAGVHLYGAARRLLASADTVRALMQNPVAAPPVRLAASATIAEVRLPRVLADLAQVEPELAVELLTTNSPVARSLVREGRCDLGLTALDPDGLPEDGLSEKVIWRDEVVIAVPPGHPWVALDEIPAEVLAATPVVQRDPMSNSSRVVAAALDRAGLQRVPPAVGIGSTAAVLEVARSTRTPALLSLLAVREFAADQGFVVRRVAGMRFDREYALVWAGALGDLPVAVQAVAQHMLDLPFARSRRASRAFS